jgi:hypothetical protein
VITNRSPTAARIAAPAHPPHGVAFVPTPTSRPTAFLGRAEQHLLLGETACAAVAPPERALMRGPPWRRPGTVPTVQDNRIA